MLSRRGRPRGAYAARSDTGRGWSSNVRSLRNPLPTGGGVGRVLEAGVRLIAAAPELLRCAVMALEELQEAARVNPLARVAIRALEAVIAAAGEHPTHPRG